MSYSQRFEEAVILAYFGETRGRFLDVGAWTGRELSNVCRLIELGWSGVCVEPSPAACTALLRNHGDNQRVEIVNAALATEAGWYAWSDSNGDAVSTLSARHREAWAHQVAYRPMVLWAVTPAQLIERFPGPYDMLSLDIEGLSVDVLERLPLADLGVRLACVEHEGREGQVREICAAAGLTVELLHSAENVILARAK